MVGDTGEVVLYSKRWKGRFGLEVELVVLFGLGPETIRWTRTLSEGGMIVASLFLIYVLHERTQVDPLRRHVNLLWPFLHHHTVHGRVRWRVR